MATTVISANLPPHIDPSKATIAYGDRALPRLNRELQSDTLLLRQRAVKALCDYLHDHEHITAALREGVVPSLKVLLKDPDVTCRQLCIECFFVLSQHAAGRDAFLDHEIILPVAEIFEDTEAICRKNAHMAIEMVSEGPSGAEGIVQAKLVPKLIEKVKIELDEIKEYILDTLHFCCRVNTDDALKSGAMEVFTQLLTHSLPTIRAKAARDIMDISVPLAGKQNAIGAETIPALIALLTDESTDVRSAAAGALAFITVTTRGKYTAINANSIPPLLPLVDDPSSNVRVNALKVITCLAEAPEGRKILLENFYKIRERETDENANVSKHAKIAIKVITWTP